MVPYPMPVRRRTSALTVVTMLVLGLGSLVIAALVVVSGGPAEAVVTICLAAVSFPALIALCFWLDRYEPEPSRYRIAALGWGAVVAVGIGLGLELALTALSGSSTTVTAVIWAPFSEELAKGTFLLLILVWRRHQLHGVVDGIVYAVLVGIGFAFTEDILYYLDSLTQGGFSGLASTFVLRGVLSPLAHPLFTSATGVGIGVAVMSRSWAVRLGAPVAGYVVAVLLHGIWNASASIGGPRTFFLTYLIVFVPLLVSLIALAVWARRREGRMLTAALMECAQMGWLAPMEIPWVATLADRVAARKYARRVGGKQAAVVVSEFQQALTEMAFLHSRVVSGTAPKDFNTQMYAILQRVAALRPGVLLPPSRVGPAVAGSYPGVTSWPPPVPPPQAPPPPEQYSPIPGQPPR